MANQEDGMAKMTRDERARLAVAGHACPRCGIIPGFLCVKMNGVDEGAARLKRPHKQRIDLVGKDEK